MDRRQGSESTCDREALQSEALHTCRQVVPERLFKPGTVPTEDVDADGTDAGPS